MNLQEKVVVVTDFSSGIGKAVAEKFAEQGATVIPHSRRSVQGGEEVVREIVQDGGSATYVQADLEVPNEGMAVAISSIH